jgi:multiple sugar transport system permease protein
VRRAGLALAVLVVAGWSLAPFAWFVVTSLKSPAEIAARPPTMLPERAVAVNYTSLVETHRIWLPIRNSAIVSALTVLVAIPLAAPAAYALARLRFRGRRALLFGILAASMFPPIIIAHTLVGWLYALGWINTFQGLIVPYVSLVLPLAIWILAAFFRDLPPELEDAARVDGCTRAGALARVVLPVAAPAVATTAILTFIYAWNEFFFASIVTDNDAVRTLPVAIAQFHGRFTLPWGEVAAASVIATLPLLVLVLALQRRIVDGLTQGAVKQ